MSTQHKDIFTENRHFQLERIILFSDAVFAIAITLLVIEIKVPHFEKRATQHDLALALLEKLPDFLSFAFSFLIIGQFWTSHHKVFGYLKDYSLGLIRLNLFTLFWIALMPFSTYLNMEFGYLNIIWFWYCTNMAFISFSIYLIWKYVGKHPFLSDIGADKIFMQYSYKRTLFVSVIFFLAGILTFCPWIIIKLISRFIFVGIFPIMSILRKKYEAKRNSQSGNKY